MATIRGPRLGGSAAAWRPLSTFAPASARAFRLLFRVEAAFAASSVPCSDASVAASPVGIAMLGTGSGARCVLAARLMGWYGTVTCGGALGLLTGGSSGS
jgi:hypothetical protein